MTTHEALTLAAESFAGRRRLTALLLMVVSLVSTLSVFAASATASVPPFDLLPTGPAPTAVPYGIGTRVFYSGYVTDLSATFTRYAAPTREFDRVVGSRGIAYTDFHSFATDCNVEIGRIAPAVPWRLVKAESGECNLFDVSTAGLVAIPDRVAAYRSDGALYAEYPRVNLGGPIPIDRVRAAGVRFVVEERDIYNGAALQGVFLWYPSPGSRPQRLPNTYVPVGRLGVGWLGARLDKFCWRTAPADNPYALRAPKLCSMAKPLLSADGTRAVLVQSGRVRVVDARTNTTVSVAALPAITGWQPGTREAVPAAWETADSYLIEAKYDGALALVRCSAATGACRRAVRSYVRSYVSVIVTERGSADAVSIP